MDKKILIVANGLSPDGGIGNCLYRMLAVINREYPDYQIDLMLNDIASAEILENTKWNIRIIPLETEKLLFKSTKELVMSLNRKKDRKKCIRIIFSRILHYFDYKLHLINLQAELTNSNNTEYDIAISYSGLPTYIVSYVSRFIEAKKKIAWAHIEIGQQNVKQIKGFTSLRIKGIKRYTKTLNCFEHIITVSDGVKDSIYQEFPEFKGKVETIYNFTDKNRIQTLSEEAIDDMEDDVQLKILTVGRLSNEKGINLAFETIKLLKDRKISFKWYFMGANQIPKYVRLYIDKNDLQTNFRYLGIKKNPYSYIKKCDIYVHTSYVEGYCTAIEEARMLAKPIITTNMAGAYEQVQDGWNGFVVQKDSQSIYEAIMKLIEHPELREQFSKNNASLDFSNESSIRKIKELLR